MGFQNAPIPPINSETLNLMPPPGSSTVVEEEKIVVEEEPFKFPPMAKEDATKVAAGAEVAATNEAGGKVLAQSQDWKPAGASDASQWDAHSEDANEKPAVVGRRQAVPKFDFEPISEELLPEVGIDFGVEAAANSAKQALGAGSVGDAKQDAVETNIDGSAKQDAVETKIGDDAKQAVETTSMDDAKPASGRRIADAGSFEKNFQEYLRRKNSGRAASELAAEVVPVAQRSQHDAPVRGQNEGPTRPVEQSQTPKSSEHDLFPDVPGRINEFPSLVHGVETNPGLQRLEEARQKVEAAQVKAFRETQGEFRGSIGDSDKYLEDTFKSYNLIMSDGMVGKAADDARKELSAQHAGLQASLDGVPGEQLREHLAMQSFDYLFGGGTAEHREAILDSMRRSGVSQFADGLKVLGDTFLRVAPAFRQEAQVKGSLEKAFNESYNMRTIYGESILHAMNHPSSSDAQKHVDMEEIAKVSQEQRSMLERFRPHLEIPQIHLELRARKNAPGVQEASLGDNRQIA